MKEAKDFLKMMKSRKSVRAFSEGRISEEEVREMKECFDSAPSANGIYPRELKFYEDKETLKLLSQTQGGASFIECAGGCFVVVGYPGRSDYWVEDGSVATENLLLAIHVLGYGGCWIAVKGQSYGEKSSSEYVKEILSLDKDAEVLCLVPVGKKK